MENQKQESGKVVVHEMLDTLVQECRDVEYGRIEFNHPSVGNVMLFYENVDVYGTVYVRFETALTDLDPLRDREKLVMISNICKAMFSSCQFAGHYMAVIHGVLIPVNSPKRDTIYKREFERMVEANLRVRKFINSNVLQYVDESYSNLVSKSFKV